MTKVQLAVALVGMGVAWFGVSTVFTMYDIPARIIPAREVAQSTPLPTLPARTNTPAATPTQPAPSTSTATAAPTDTPAPTATGTATAIPVPTPIPTETPIPTATSTHTATPTASATATPAPTAPPTATPVPMATSTPPPPPTQIPGETIGRYGIARAVGNLAAVMREQPATSSPQRASIPVGTRVEVLRVVRGEAIDPVEPRWYEVKYADKLGYVYFKLIALVD